MQRIPCVQSLKGGGIMDRYEKSAEFIMKRGDRIIVEKKHRKAIIMRSTALGLGAAAIVGVGIWANALKPPKKPTAENSNIIFSTTETTITSDMNSLQTTNYSAKTAQQLTVTTSIKTYNFGEREKKTTNSSEPQLTCRTSVAIDERIETKSTNSTSIVTEDINTSMAVTTSNIAIETTVTTGISGISLGEDDYYFKYLDNEYRILDTPVNEGCVNLSTLANVSVYTKNDDNTFDANIFSLNDISSDFAIAIVTDDKSYQICRNYWYTPNSLYNLIDDIGLKKYWKTDSEYANSLTAVFSLENADVDLYASPGKAVSSFPVYNIDFGMNYATIELTEKGYLTFTLSGYTYVFNIGHEQLNNYMSSIK